MKEHFGCIVALRSPAHITLIPPFWLEEEYESTLQDTLKSFNPGIDKINIILDGFAHFNRRVLFIRVKDHPGLSELRTKSEIHFMSDFGGVIKTDNRPFHPHVTIANRDLKPGVFEKAWPHFAEREFKESYVSGDVSLLKLVSGKWMVVGEKKI